MQRQRWARQPGLRATGAGVREAAVAAIACVAGPSAAAGACCMPAAPKPQPPQLSIEQRTFTSSSTTSFTILGYLRTKVEGPGQARHTAANGASGRHSALPHCNLHTVRCAAPPWQSSCAPHRLASHR